MRNPPWARDELILALDLYRRSGDRMPGQTSAEVGALSHKLNQIGAALGGERRADYRNANGVYMKLMNFRRFNPEFVAAGKRGLARGNKDEELVWNEFANYQARLRTVAQAIVDASTEFETGGALVTAGDELEEAPVGRLLTALHVRRERSRTLVERRKARALEQHGAICCEACDLDFGERYGERETGFIEVRHTPPLHELPNGGRTRVDGLTLLCANCHRMVHRRAPWLTVAEVAALIRRS